MGLKTIQEREQERQEVLRSIDVDADAAAILSSATRAATAILDRRRQMDEIGLADTPLLVLASETHAMPAHCLRHLAMLDQVYQAVPETVFLKEIPHDTGIQTLSQIFQERTGEALPPDALARLREQDRDCSLSMSALSARQLMQRAPHSHEVLNQAILHRGIPVRLTDAAYTRPDGRGDHYLNHEDPTTAASMESCIGVSEAEISIVDDTGMHIRNHHMLTQGAAFAKENYARIVIQQCGGYHTLGGGEGNNPAHSLAALAKDINMPVVVLPVMEGLASAHVAPEGHGLAPEEILAADDLPDYSAIYDPHSGMRFHVGVFQTREEEAGYVNDVLTRMGLGGDALSVEDFRLSQEYNRRSLQTALDQAVAPDAAAPETRRPQPFFSPKV